MNEFRSKILGRETPRGSLLRAKAVKHETSRAAEEESFADLSIPREAHRAANHRDSDRHRLTSEQAVLSLGDDVQTVTLINLSGGGAMVSGAANLKLWDRVELRLGPCDPLEAIVRWVREDRIGLEFAHETRIGAADDAVADTLRSVIRRSFPDIVLEAVGEAEAAPETAPAAPDPASSDRAIPASEERELRHPLIWTGTIHYNHDSTPVRLRNISSGGALVEGQAVFPVGAELLLDLGEGGTIFASVHWAHGDQSGLKFHVPYDVNALALARPQIASASWVAPDYLRDGRAAASPWSSQWDRWDLASIHRALRRPSKIARKD